LTNLNFSIKNLQNYIVGNSCKRDASNISRMFKCYVRNYIKLYNSHYSTLL